MPYQPIVDLLEAELPCLFDEIAPGVLMTTLAGSRTRVRIDEAISQIHIATPVNGAHNGLPAPHIAELLKLNFPNDLLGQSFLAQGNAAGHLDLIDIVTVTSVTPRQAFQRILDQIRASIEISLRIADARLGAALAIGDI